MTRMPTLAGVISIAVMTASGAVSAAPAYTQHPPSPALAAMEKSGTVPWHREWQYGYGHHGEWLPGWVAVLNNR
jgi:hypothetical protein